MEKHFYLWRTVDHKGEVLECLVTKRRNKAAAKKFLKNNSKTRITQDYHDRQAGVLWRGFS